MEKIGLGIVVCEFNYEITNLMLQRALEHAEFLDAQVLYIFKVPGAFDAPFGVQKLIEKKEIDGVAVLGAIIEGDTKHDEIIAQHSARKILDVSLNYKKPVSLGISGPGMTLIQAQERIDEYAKRAIEAVVKMVRRIRKLEEKKKAEFPIVIQ